MSYSRNGFGKEYEIDFPVIGKKKVDLPVEEIGTDIGNSVEKELKASMPDIKDAAVEQLKKSAPEFAAVIPDLVSEYASGRILLGAVILLGSIWGAAYWISQSNKQSTRAILKSLKE
jgi:hypothetical protein